MSTVIYQKVSNALEDINFSYFNAMIVEDNDFVRFMVKKILMELGFKNVFEASNGSEAIQLLTQEPHVIICDIQMEPMNGFEFLEYVRKAEDAQSKLPFIFLTSTADASAVQKAVDMKIDAYMLKPVTPEGLKKKLISVMQKAMTR